jgi:hypothetical protein
MSVMSDIDLLHRDGAVSQNDFIERGIAPDKAEAYASVVAEFDHASEPDGEGFFTVYCTGQ